MKKLMLPFLGLIFATVSILLNGISDILITKSNFFSGFDNAFIRFTIQILILASIARFKGLNHLGPVESRTFLIGRGILGAVGKS